MGKAEVEEQTPGGAPDVLDPDSPENPDAQPDEPGAPLEAPSEPSDPDAQPDAPNPDEEPAEVPAEPAPPAQRGSSLDAQKEMMDKAYKRANSYVKGVVEILGDASNELQGCPRCSDFLPGFVLPHSIKPVTPEQRVAVKVSMGEDAEPQYVLDRDAATCARCQGWGKVLTGSHVRNQDKATCPGCHGRGFTGPLATTATMPQPELVAATVAENGADETPAPETDPWGRMKGDANYGILPGYELT